MARCSVRICRPQFLSMECLWRGHAAGKKVRQLVLLWFHCGVISAILDEGSIVDKGYLVKGCLADPRDARLISGGVGTAMYSQPYVQCSRDIRTRNVYNDSGNEWSLAETRSISALARDLVSSVRREWGPSCTYGW